METVGTPLLWIGFLAFVLAMLALDLGVFQRKAHAVGLREAALVSAGWIALSLVFNVGVYYWFGAGPALEFLTGYLLEKTLSVDNIFVFVVLFAYFGVPAVHQHRVLFWGILGALLTRGLFIFLGAALISRFHWVIYVLGGLLVFSGAKLLRHKNEDVIPEKNLVLRLFRRFIPTTAEFHGRRFLVKQGGRRHATPLLVALVAVEATDVIFAVDSIPAIFAVTRDPFIVFTSNIFAILGLRALYFLLAGVIAKFRYLRLGLGLVLGFVGVKMLLSGVFELPVWASLLVIVALLGGSILASLLRPAPAVDLPLRPPGGAGAPAG
jgi:tellurite resistance protein TerC